MASIVHSHHHQHEHPHHHGHRHAHHHTSVRAKDEYSTNQFVRFLQKVQDKFKGVDGIDETAQVAGIILPGLAGPIATAAVLGIATPFVYLGMMGMVEEYNAACEEYNEILASQKSTAARLNQLTSSSDKWMNLISARLGLGIAPRKYNPNTSKIGLLTLQGKELEEFVYNVVKYENLRNSEFTAALGQKYGWTGAVGMGGMFGGMLPATARAGIGIAEELGKASPAVLGVGTALEIAAGSTFLAGQAAMFAYAANRARQGFANEKLFLSNKDNFLKYSGSLSDSTRNSVAAIIDKNIDLNDKHSIKYGIATDVGQAGMIFATGMGLLAALGVIISLPFLPLAAVIALAIGAPLTVLAAIGRIIFEAKEENFKGSGENKFAHDRMHETDILPLTDRAMRDKNAPSVKQVLEQEFQSRSSQIAHAKLYSLINHALNDEGSKDLSPQEKMAHLEAMVASGDISFFKGTGLRGDIMGRVKAIFSHEYQNIAGLFNLPQDEANKVLCANLVNCANSGASFNLSARVDNATLSKLLEELGVKVDINDLKAVNNELIPALKGALKAIWNDVAEKLIHTTNMDAVRNIIAQENQNILGSTKAAGRGV